MKYHHIQEELGGSLLQGSEKKRTDIAPVSQAIMVRALGFKIGGHLQCHRQHHHHHHHHRRHHHQHRHGRQRSAQSLRGLRLHLPETHILFAVILASPSL